MPPVCASLLTDLLCKSVCVQCSEMQRLFSDPLGACYTQKTNLRTHTHTHTHTQYTPKLRFCLHYSPCVVPKRHFIYKEECFSMQ